MAKIIPFRKPRRLTPEIVGELLRIHSSCVHDQAGKAYWFTASTSFANPAVTIARSLSDTFAGIRPADAPLFIAAQVLGALAATFLFRWLVPTLPSMAKGVLVKHDSEN